MKVLVLIFGVITNDGQIDLVKVPNSELKNINSCEKAIETLTKWQLNPKSKPGNYEVWGYYTYKNKPIMLRYCTENGVYSG